MMAGKKVPPQEAAFLADILDHSDDDPPRLVYADWLEENGQARRAEFIRLQCQLPSLSEDDPQRGEWQERQADLLTVYGQRWQPAWPAWALKERHEYRRGFVSTLGLTLKHPLPHAQTLFPEAPP